MVKEQIKTANNQTAFQKACAAGITGEELRRRLYEDIEKWEWNER